MLAGYYRSIQRPLREPVKPDFHHFNQSQINTASPCNKYYDKACYKLRQLILFQNAAILLEIAIVIRKYDVIAYCDVIRKYDVITYCDVIRKYDVITYCDVIRKYDVITYCDVIRKYDVITYCDVIRKYDVIAYCNITHANVL